MKKIITVAMSLFIMTTMMTTGIHAENSDDSDDLNSDGDSTQIGVSTAENISNAADTDSEVYKVTVAWSTDPATYSRTDKLKWNPATMIYEVANGTGTPSTTAATATITLTNYSNVKVDYDITFASAETGTGDDAKAIASEAKAAASTADASGNIASADTKQSTSTAGTAQSVTYTGTISYITDNYIPENGNNTTMGTYTVTISKPLTLSKSSVSLKVGKTETITANKTGVTWSTSDSNVATVTDGTITAIGAGSATITATANGKTATCEVTVTAKPTAYQFNPFSTTWNYTWKDTLLNSSTVDFIYEGTTYTAYNGFIGETCYATWDNAQDFVRNLNADTANGATNTTKVLPNGVTDASSGSWILLSSEGMAQAWATASGANESTHVFANYDTVFEGVYYLWSSAVHGSSYGCNFICNYGTWNFSYKSDSYAGVGFVVLWAPSSN